VKVVEVLLDGRLFKGGASLVIRVVETEIVFIVHQKLAEVNVGASFVNVRGHIHLQGLIEKEVWRDHRLLLVRLLRRKG
jgi:hypothetical protein